MPIKRLKITNYEALGLLVKTWATGENRLDKPGRFLPIPKTIAEFTGMLVHSGATTQLAVDEWLASFDGSMKRITFVQSTPEELVIRLPMRKMLEDTEKQIDMPGFYYPLPAFYSVDFFAGAPESINDYWRTHAERIGDYTIAQCG
ncbi:hypothetical protein [Phreatobacter stygius]|uniref:Uncharacterized protein n=1 Tax=Phreatobacter stygius TaxID=1940610 RepID=A0A4D7B9S6_9HYPH|nr:hypothetical protein [Phreatobacter stygius]QCI67605.1 hypothetical protein E8M01_27285 [Phreatobacter stygius]